jgi:hypothetical protein
MVGYYMLALLNVQESRAQTDINAMKGLTQYGAIAVSMSETSVHL